MSLTLSDMVKKLSGKIKMEFEVERLDPLFTDEADFDRFLERQNQYKVKKGDLSTYKGNCYLGIDAGSTTTKTALVLSLIHI